MEDCLIRESPFTEVEQGSDYILCDVAANVSAKIVDEQLAGMMIPFGLSATTPTLPEHTALVGALTATGKYLALREPLCGACGMLFTEDSNFCRVCGIRRGDACLDGEWKEGSARNFIRGPTIEWANGVITKIDVIGPSSFTTTLTGDLLTAHIEHFGKRLLWSTGNVWTSVSEQEQLPFADLPQPEALLAQMPSADRPAQGRFTSRRRPKATSEESQAAPSRPGRLAGPIGGMEGDPFSWEPQSLTSCSSSSAAAPPLSACFEDLPAFRHLAALEEAVSSGAAMEGRLPALPGRLRDEQGNVADGEPSALAVPPGCQPPSPRSARMLRGMSPRVHSPRSARSLRGPGGVPLQSAGAGVLAANNTTMPGSRVLFHDGIWGLQPPALAGAKGAGGGAKTMGFGNSVLRGNTLSKRCRGPAATAMWVGSEGGRLRAEAPKSLGTCTHLAFLANGGPQRMDPLSGDLC